jgi:hypothetical protein
MATRDIKDGKPLHWSFSGGRHNGMSRHRGMRGLWYLYETHGQGRLMASWTFHVFPDSVSISGYQGRDKSRVLTEALRSRSLFVVEGRGGRDYGKSAGSKGGARAGGPISYSVDVRGETVGFDQALLSDGDEFLRQVFDYEPTPRGVREAASRDETSRVQKEAEAAAAEEAFWANWHQGYADNQAAEEAARKHFETLFKGFDIPEGFKSRITSTGLEVYRDRGEKWTGWSRLYDQATITTVEEYVSWYEVALVTLNEEATEAHRRAWVEDLRAEEDEVASAKVAAEQAAIAAKLDELTELLSGL